MSAQSDTRQTVFKDLREPNGLLVGLTKRRRNLLIQLTSTAAKSVRRGRRNLKYQLDSTNDDTKLTLMLLEPSVYSTLIPTSADCQRGGARYLARPPFSQTRLMAPSARVTQLESRARRTTIHCVGAKFNPKTKYQ